MNLNTLICTIKENINNTTEIMEKYNGNEWKDYLLSIMPIDKTSYKKIAIDKNDIFEVYLIFWFYDAVSPIHDHPNEGCIMKIIEGELIEDTYQNNGDYSSTFIQRNILNKNLIANRFGNEILHQIFNKTELTVSLHVYFPPNFKHNIYIGKK